MRVQRIAVTDMAEIEDSNERQKAGTFHNEQPETRNLD